jgi:hypothetical protein
MELWLAEKTEVLGENPAFGVDGDGTRMWIIGGMTTGIWRKSCPSNTNPEWTDLELNPGLRGERPVTNLLSSSRMLHIIQQPWYNDDK